MLLLIPIWIVSNDTDFGQISDSADLASIQVLVTHYLQTKTHKYWQESSQYSRYTNSKQEKFISKKDQDTTSQVFEQYSWTRSSNYGHP